MQCTVNYVVDNVCSLTPTVFDSFSDFQCVSTFYTSHLGLTVTDGENGKIQLHVTRNLRTKAYNCWVSVKLSSNDIHHNTFTQPTCKQRYCTMRRLSTLQKYGILVQKTRFLVQLCYCEYNVL